MSDAYDNFRTVVFVDTNLVLECLPLQKLPWAKIDSIGPILILVTPTVIKEVDKKKRDGRVGQRARDFRRLMAPLTEGETWVSISDGTPAVSL